MSSNLISSIGSINKSRAIGLALNLATAMWSILAATTHSAVAVASPARARLDDELIDRLVQPSRGHDARSFERAAAIGLRHNACGCVDGLASASVGVVVDRSTVCPIWHAPPNVPWLSLGRFPKRHTSLALRCCKGAIHPIIRSPRRRGRAGSAAPRGRARWRFSD